MKRNLLRAAIAASMVIAMTSACTSVGQVGIMTRPGANPGALLTQATPYEEIGWAEGEACRYFLLAVIPWGNSTATRALEKALAQAGGDALINVTVSTNLYGFVPIYNVFQFHVHNGRRYGDPLQSASGTNR